MKIHEYLYSDIKFEPIRISEYVRFLNTICTTQPDIFKRIFISEDTLEYGDIIDIFKNFKNAVICISSGDIDFPPPKKPYRYDKYFNVNMVPTNYRDILYYDKISMELLTVLEENNLFVISQDVSIYNPRIVAMPLGIYPKWNFLNVNIFKQFDKNILCYVNYGIPNVEQWFGSPRLSIYEIIKNNPCIYIENTCNNEHRNVVNLDNFYKKIASSKFAICPRGLGIDTYRLWDCIYLGCIPIVEKYDGHKDWEDLPIYFVDSLDFYRSITQEKLEEIYHSMSKVEYNYEKLNMSYWKSRILTLGNLL